MTDEQLKSLLAAADQSTGPLPMPASHLAVRARQAFHHQQTCVRRRIFAAGLLACYAAGVLTMWGAFALTSARTHPASSAMAENHARADRGPRQTPESSTSASPSKPDVILRPMPEPFQEFNPYQMWRNLGDLYQARHQYALALEYYTRALDVAASGQMEISTTDDNWLLISLKRERPQATKKTKKGNTI